MNKDVAMNKKRRLLLFIILLPILTHAPHLLNAQTAVEMDTMLTLDTVSAAKAARFVLESADLLPAGLSGADAEKAAYDMASSNGWVNVASGDAVTLKDTAFLVMKAFDLKGGVMYSLFKNPRYAYREMIYHKLILGRSDQSMKVSGTRLLHIIDRTLSYAGNEGDIK